LNPASEGVAEKWKDVVREARFGAGNGSVIDCSHRDAVTEHAREQPGVDVAAGDVSEVQFLASFVV
jgi:hypothetical protein